MTSSNNLADMFFTGGATQSQHIDASDDQHFEDTTFRLKRTRSMGLLDDFIAPSNHPKAEDFISDETIDELNGTKDTPLKEPTLKEPTPTDGMNQMITDENSNSAQLDDDDASYESPSVTPLPSEELGHVTPYDDNDLTYEPSSHVDYLSHNWKESDISKSWRYIISKRKDVANSARLENASWRTWAQAKYGLKTISPEEVNWLKDCDVTWLYGPLYKEPTQSDLYKGGRTKNSAASLNHALRNKPIKKESKSRNLNAPKPILKKRSVAERILSHASYMRLQAQMHDQQHSPSNDSTSSSPMYGGGSPSIASHDLHRSASPMSLNHSAHLDLSHTTSVGSVGTEGVKKDRKIHFNERVDQCEAIDDSEVSDHHAEEEEEDDFEDEEGLFTKQSEGNSDSDSDSDEGGFFLRVRSPSSASLHKPVLSRLQSNNSEKKSTSEVNLESSTISLPESLTSSLKQIKTIKPLPPTKINYGSDDSDYEAEYSDDSDDNYQKYTQSHNTKTNRGYDYRYDYNTVYTGDITDANQNLKVYDVPEGIDLGSNFVDMDQQPPSPVEHLERSSDAANFALHDDFDHDNDPEFVEQVDASSANKFGLEPLEDVKSLPPKTTSTVASGKSAFLFGNDDNSDESSSSDSEEETSIKAPQPSRELAPSDEDSEHPPLLKKNSSYASLSEIAANGYRSKSPRSPVTQKALSPNIGRQDGSVNSSPTASLKNAVNSAKGFASQILGRRKGSSSPKNRDNN